jgi:ABC-type phosphate/phosphonate transport system substrate-binding protein
VRIADLPWYDLEELEHATDAWWLGIARHLRARGVDRVPDQLTRAGSHSERWQHHDLLLSQACGYDVLYDAAATIAPIATPCYTADGCEGPRYRSFVFVRADRPFASIADLRGARVVVNEAASHSGTNALRPLIAPLATAGSFFGDVAVSGSHTDSLHAVRHGAADVACIDAVVVGLLQNARPQALHGLRPLARTGPALAPPYVTSTHTPPALRRALQDALRDAVQDPGLAGCRRTLLLDDFTFLPAAAYGELRDFEAAAMAHGYRELPAPRTSPLSAGVAAQAGRGSCGDARSCAGFSARGG